ncbi:hypothetical protein AC578_7488 [Pseudocercospora eumusae]|uniref:2EXR domain-containing protein n=1 Tax=Pseudocercospora eumusae TaxID=321146 RepID=A0A139GWG2_9PEZI|nr:hypothetical protein AC578_7488 [Pseudocercospora eumusae]
MADEAPHEEHPEADPEGTPFFDKLPREIRDEIYRLAYVEESGRVVRIISRKDWVEGAREGRRYGGYYDNRRGTSKTFPDPPLLAMHVSRQFEAEAVQQWFRHQTVDCLNLTMWNDLCKRDPRITDNVISLRCSWRGGISCAPLFASIRACKSMRELQLKISDSAFDAIDGFLACQDDYGSREFCKLEAQMGLCSMKALQKVAFSPVKTRHITLAQTPEEKRKWESNLLEFEDYINRRIQQNRAV